MFSLLAAAAWIIISVFHAMVLRGAGSVVSCAFLSCRSMCSICVCGVSVGVVLRVCVSVLVFACASVRSRLRAFPLLVPC